MRHALRTVTVLAGAGMILIGGMFVGLELLKDRMGRGAPSVVRCAVFALVVAGGVALIWKSAAIARRLADDFDDE